MRNVVMKWVKNFLFLIILLFFNTHSYAQMLDQAIIDKKSIEIEKKMTQNRYLMYSLTTMAIAYGIYEWMPLLMDMASNMAASAQKQEKSTTTEEKSESTEKRSFSQVLKDGAASFKSGASDLFHDLFCTKESWLSFLQYTVSLTGAGIINQVTEKFMHPDTLRWYVHTHAPYHATIKLMKEQISSLQDPSLSDEQHEVSSRMIPLLYDRLVRQAHFMCAYISYKIKRLDEAEKIIGQHTKESLIKTHTRWLTHLKEHLDSKTFDLDAIAILLDKYYDAVSAQINHFALTEGETKKERVAIKRLTK